MLPVIDYQVPSLFHYLGNPYLSREDTARIVALVKSVNAKVMIEFGCQEGRTAWAILASVPTLQDYFGIDVPPDYIPRLDQWDEIPKSAGLLVENDPRFRLVIRRRGSFDLRWQDLPFCDAVFIDGDHSLEAVIHDSELARALVRSPGVIIWHDYGNPTVEVTEALDSLAHKGWPIRVIRDTWLAFRMV
jgi:predicted O-methyltransferase YrrM